MKRLDSSTHIDTRARDIADVVLAMTGCLFLRRCIHRLRIGRINNAVALLPTVSCRLDSWGTIARITFVNVTEAISDQRPTERATNRRGTPTWSKSKNRNTNGAGKGPHLPSIQWICTMMRRWRPVSRQLLPQLLCSLWGNVLGTRNDKLWQPNEQRPLCLTTATRTFCGSLLWSLSYDVSS